MRKNILLLATGGTIASQRTPYGLIPALKPEELLSYLPELEKNLVIHAKSLFSIDSTNMQPSNWIEISKAIEDMYDEYDGFVIAHGTDTMAYTAAAVSYMIQNSSKPIVFTGAQKPIGLEITDAKANLRDSIIYAADEHSHGVQIVFDGKVIAGTRAKKTRTMSFAAFSSINYPFIATIHDGRIIRFIDNYKTQEPVTMCHELNTRVFLLKLVPGMQPDLLPKIFELYDGVIIESFGAGGVPESIEKQLFCELSKYDPLEKVVVMTTQVQYEGSNLNVYQVGRKISANFHVLEARDLTLEAAYTKLMWVLAHKFETWEDLRDCYYAPVGCDTLF